MSACKLSSSQVKARVSSLQAARSSSSYGEGGRGGGERAG
jgi:hypothetical protein